MSANRNWEDIPFLLFLVPFALNGLYAIYLWVQFGVSSTLPQTVFLQVTESPYVFLIGFLAVIFGAIIDVLKEEPAERRAKLVHESTTLQVIALLALILGALSAWYAAGFDLGTAASNILQGRYVIIFPALLVLFSFLMLPSVSIKKNQIRNAIMIVLLLAVPVTIDELGKRSFFAGMGLGLVFLIAAVYLYVQRQTTKPKTS